MFLANPNNRIGSDLPRGQIARLHARLPIHALLLLDQANAEYLTPEDDDGGLTLAAVSANLLGRWPFQRSMDSPESGLA